MTCQDLDDALLDLGRGTVLGPGSVGAVESHVEHCARCAARLARERELTAGLRALAASTATEAGSPELERQLMRAFADLHPSQDAEHRSSGTRGWFAAAAAAVIVVGAWALGVALLRGPEPVAPASSNVAQTQPVVPVPPATGNGERPDGANPEVAAPVIPSDATPPRADSRRPRTSRKPAGDAAEPATMEGFVALPAAAGLPALESGRIIRIDVAVASLPAYGVEVIPDLRRPEVEADLLVGQDGQPRAIRLVTVSSNSRSRE
jgi:hypothetical protein